MTVDTKNELTTVGDNFSSSSNCRLLCKFLKSHNRGIVGLSFIANNRNDLYLSSISHDSLKIWSGFESNDENINLNQIKSSASWLCSIQSLDIVAGERELVTVALGIESTLYILKTNYLDFDIVVNSCPNSLMRALFVRISPDNQYILTLNYFGYIELRDHSGDIVKAVLADKIKNTSALAYGHKYIVLGNTHGFINIFDSKTFLYNYHIEAHSTKVRCLEFIREDYILSGADDKIIKLYQITDTKGTVSRTYCGHKGAVHSISIDFLSAGERFASCSSDNTIIIWNFASGEKICFFDCSASMENDVIRCAAFSPWGNLLAVGTDEATILVFEIPFMSSTVYGAEDTSVEVEETSQFLDASASSEFLLNGNRDVFEEIQQHSSVDQDSQTFEENGSDFLDNIGSFT